jgi:plastocyanin
MNKTFRALVTGSLIATVAASSMMLNAAAQGVDGVGGEGFPPFSPKVVSLKKTTTGTSSTAVGGEFDYVLEIHNRTEATATVALTDRLPVETQIVGQPSIAVITPEVSTDAPVVMSDTVKWNGSLNAGAKAAITIRVKLMACPSVHHDRSRGVTNTATMLTDKGVSVANVSFAPAGCAGPPKPTPTPPPPSESGADVSVRKLGRLHPDWDFPERGWRASWLVLYRNRGGQVATGASLLDSPSANQTLEGIRSAPLITPVTTAGGLLFDLGTLQAQRTGAILLRTSVPFSTSAGTQLTNRAAITASNDTKTSNNTAGVTLTIPTLAPIITYPRSGLTFTGTLTIQGKAQTGSSVDLYVDGEKIGTYPVSATGVWSQPVQLADGVHVIYARNMGESDDDDEDDDDLSGLSSQGDGDDDGPRNHGRQSNVVILKVKSELIYDPISLTFTDPDGRRTYPRGWLGWHDEANWYVSLQPSTTYTVGVRVCCAGAAVTLTVPSTSATDVTLTDTDGDLIYTGNFTTGASKQLVRGPIKLCVSANGVTQCASGRVVPHWRKAKWVIGITPEGFDPPRINVSPGDVVEFINMSDVARAFGTSRDLSAAMSAQSADAGNDAVRLEVGESTTIEISQAQTYYDADNANQTATVAIGGGVYVPMVVR